MHFTKMHGAGNDFIIINNIDGAIPESVLPELAAGLCAQHVSVGADGMMVVAAPRQGGDFHAALQQELQRSEQTREVAFSKHAISPRRTKICSVIVKPAASPAMTSWVGQL